MSERAVVARACAVVRRSSYKPLAAAFFLHLMQNAALGSHYEHRTFRRVHGILEQCGRRSHLVGNHEQPDESAGCSLADSCPAGDFRRFISEHPGHTVVS